MKELTVYLPNKLCAKLGQLLRTPHRIIKELLEEAETILYEDSHTGEKFLMPAPSSDKVHAIYDNLGMRFINTPCRYAE